MADDIEQCGEEFEEIISSIIVAFEQYHYLKHITEQEYTAIMFELFEELEDEKYQGCVYEKEYSDMLKIVDEFPWLLEWVL